MSFTFGNSYPGTEPRPPPPLQAPSPHQLPISTQTQARCVCSATYITEGPLISSLLLSSVLPRVFYKNIYPAMGIGYNIVVTCGFMKQTHCLRVAYISKFIEKIQMVFLMILLIVPPSYEIKWNFEIHRFELSLRPLDTMKRKLSTPYTLTMILVGYNHRDISIINPPSLLPSAPSSPVRLMHSVLMTPIQRLKYHVTARDS